MRDLANPSSRRESFPPSRRVIDTVANAEGVDPADLRPLYEAIDPDALDALFARRSAECGQVTFRFHG